MTKQPSNQVFHASSFLQGPNAAYIEQLYARYADNPNAVDEAWQQFFRELGDSETEAQREKRRRPHANHAGGPSGFPVYRHLRHGGQPGFDFCGLVI